MKPLLSVLLITLTSIAAQAGEQAMKVDSLMIEQRNSYTVSSYAGFVGPVVRVYLYNPPVEEVTYKYPYKEGEEIQRLDPSLTCTGSGLPDGRFSFIYRIEGEDTLLYEGNTEVGVTDGWFEVEITLKNKPPEARGVSWELVTGNTTPIKGYAPLSWSHFHGRVKYLDGEWRSTYIALWPVTWGSPGRITVPVLDDGHFDALVPARVYAVVNVNGTGYSYDTLERWAWDYDLTKDREDEFTIGRTELYGMRAFDINGGPSTLFVIFRPTALSRVLRFDCDGDGFVKGEEVDRMNIAMRESPTVIGPELKAGDVKVWLNGKEEEVVQFNMIPEHDGDTWQVQYLLQVHPESKPLRGRWHEIKVEVQSKEVLHGKEVVDFGQGSVGFYRP